MTRRDFGMLEPGPERGGRVLSPVLLLGAGTGEATCGILYLAGYLRRNGIQAYVRLWDSDESEQELEGSLKCLMAHVRPALVGISLKWFHHLARALFIADALRGVDPQVRIALGGNTASYFWRELGALDSVDYVVLGDGEVPLLALCRGQAAPPNVVTRSRGGVLRCSPRAYVQRAKSTEISYSHFDEIFLSRLDLHSFSGWVAPGKGCGENCLYCGGARGLQRATFGRAAPFLRAEQSVRADHLEIAPRTWQLRYDFAGSTPAFLERAWAGIDLSRHSTTYFLWGVPSQELVALLAETFQRVFLVLDIGCFSQSQRQKLMGMGLLKPCPSDGELLEIIDTCRQHQNLELEISGIAGLPFADRAALEQERHLVERLLSQGCSVGYQRLEAQPGALVTEHSERFDMVTEARTFAQFLDYFKARDWTDQAVPMVRFRNQNLETAVRESSEYLEDMLEAHSAQRVPVLHGRTRLINASASILQFQLGEWLGRYRVPAPLAREPVTVVRSIDGTGLACAPSLSRRRFSNPMLQQGEAAAALLAVLAAFERPATVDAALGRLRSGAQLKADSARELMEHLVLGRFLRQA